MLARPVDCHPSADVKPARPSSVADLRPMALKKSELYSSLWASCDALRGGMDASQYKDYVLVMLFIKYVSDKFAGQPYAPIVIPEGASFADMVALKGPARASSRSPWPPARPSAPCKSSW